MKYLITLALLILSSWCNSGLAQPTLILSTVTDFPPFNYIEDGKLTGIDIDIVEEMAKQLDIKVKILSATWKGVMLQIKAGRVDGGFSAFLAPERQKFSIYTAPLHYEAMHLFVKRDASFPFTSLHDLEGKVIAIEKGAFISKEFQLATNAQSVIVHEGKNTNNLRMLGINRLDGVIGHLEVMQYHLKKLDLHQRIIPLASIGKAKPAYLILSKKSKYPNLLNLKQNITTVLTRMQQEGTYQDIANHHLAKR